MTHSLKSSHSLLDKSQSRAAPLYKVWAALVVSGVAFLDLFHRFHPAWAVYGGFDDDFFYYAQVARHIAQGAGSTFDGVHLTNGYHPLWLFCLTLFSAIDSGRLFFPLVTLAAILSLASIFILTVQCLRRLGVPPAGQYVVATLVTFWSDLLLRGGMEITLALPLILLLLYLWLDPHPRSLASFFQLGLLASLCILARLDSAILVALLFVATMRFDPQPAARWLKRTVAFGCGLAPFWAYLILNRIFFGSLLPISAQAKQLRLHHTPQFEPLLSLVHPFTTVRLILVLPGVLGTILLLTLLRQQRRDSPTTNAVLWALALFPIVQVVSLCFLSDWPLWYWYFYPLVLASFAAITAWITSNSLPPKIWAGFALGITVVIFGYTVAYHLGRPPAKNPVFLAARDIAAFAESHPGIYAMGDRAGTVGYLLPSPLIQLEGLMMDQTYLQRMRTQTSLPLMLREYGVTYYVSTNARLEDACYVTREPSQSGPDSPHMSGVFCRPPVATFSHDTFVTRIFKVTATQQKGTERHHIDASHSYIFTPAAP